MTEGLSKDELVKKIFGNIHRVRVWAAVVEAVEETGRFYKFEALNILETDTSRSRHAMGIQLHRGLADMEEMGMVRRLDDAPHRTYYEQLESPLWDLARLAIETVAKLYPDE